MTKGPGQKKSRTSNGKQAVDRSRRDFLRKSAYAAYAAPVITTLLVEQASAASSSNKHCSDPIWAATHPQVCG